VQFLKIVFPQGLTILTISLVSVLSSPHPLPLALPSPHPDPILPLAVGPILPAAVAFAAVGIPTAAAFGAAGIGLEVASE